MSRFDGLPVALRNLRLASGLTGVEVANELGTKGSSISRWENGKEVPGLTNLGKLLDLYGLTLADFEDALALAQGRPLAQRSARLPRNEAEVETYLQSLLGAAESKAGNGNLSSAAQPLRTALGTLLLAAGRLAAELGVSGPTLPPARQRRSRATRLGSQ